MKQLTKKEIGMIGLVLGLLALGFYLRFFVRGMGFCGNLILCASAYGLLYTGCYHHRKKKVFQIFRIAMVTFFILGLGYFAFMESVILSHAKTDNNTKTEAVVVFGSAVYGRRPSFSLKSRLDATVSYAKEHPDIPIIVSGGKGSGEDISEAQCMEEYLINAGVASARIYKEDKSTSTEENIAYSKSILKTLGISEDAFVATVSSDYHLARIAHMWHGNTVPVAAVLPDYLWTYTLAYYVREAFGLTAAWVFS